MTGRTIEAPRSRYQPAGSPTLGTAGLATARLLTARTHRLSSQPSSRHSASATRTPRPWPPPHSHIDAAEPSRARVHRGEHPLRVSALCAHHRCRHDACAQAHGAVLRTRDGRAPTHRQPHAQDREHTAGACTIGILPLRRVLPRFGPPLTSGSGLQPARRLIQVRVGAAVPTPPASSAYPRLHTLRRRRLPSRRCPARPSAAGCAHTSQSILQAARRLLRPGVLRAGPCAT